MKPHHNLLNRTGLPALGLLALTALPIRASDYPTTVLSFNPLAYYRLSETAPAPAANTTANFGSLSGTFGLGFPGSDLTNRPVGIVGNCYKFINPGAGFGYDGNSFIDVGWQAAMNPPLGHPFSLEVWAQPSAVNNDLVCAACSLNVNQSRSGYLLYLDSANHRWEFRMGGTGSYCGITDSAVGSAVVGAWHHVVCVYDGGNLLLYVNGVKVAGPTPATSGAGYNPNNSQPFRIGATTFPNRGFDGLLDEIAFYGTNLSASTIAAHYAAATTNNAGYHAQILLDNPVGYWYMDDPPYTPPNPNTFPVTTNAGSLAGANGTNNPGVLTGASGPPFSGMGANNLGIQNLYGAGNADLGSPAGLDIVGPITMMAWIQPQYTLGLRDIVAHGFGASSEVFMRINNGVYEVGSWDGTTTFAVQGAMNTGGVGSDVGNWVFIAATYDGANWNLYRYDNLVTNAPFTSGSLSVPDAPWSIGSAGPNGNGRWLGGGIDEVAIFNTALTTAQIQQIFYSANVTPIVVTPLPSQVSPPVYVGTSLNLVVAAEGNKPLSYSWTKNGVALGNTTTSLSINNLQTTDSGTYAVVVTNPSGSTTSSVPVTVLLVPPEIVQQPAAESRYVGGTANFSINVIGSSPLSYQWKSNGIAIGGATGTNYTIPAVQTSFAANYSCMISGPGGVTNSANAALTVVAVPTSSFPVAVLADNPLGYWRLSKTNGTVAHDYWNGHDGVYHGAVALGLPGFSQTHDGDTAAGFGSGGTTNYAGDITGFDFSGTGKPFSIECWVNGPAGQTDGSTMIGKGNGNSGVATTHWQFLLQTLGGSFDFHVENTAGAAADAQAPGLGPDGTWHHLVATYDAGGSMTLYVDGTVAAGGAGPAGGPSVTTLPMSIGAGRSGVTPIYDQPFTGSMDEVAIYNYALTSDQVLAHALAGFGSNVRPIFLAQPQSVTNYVTYAENLTVSASGTPPLSYQWYKNGSPLSDNGIISGSSSRALSINPLDTPDTGNYYCTVTNTAGSSNSATATLTVLAAPTTPPAIAGLVLHLPFDNNLSDVTGRGNNGTGVGGPTFVTDGKLGQALHYATTTLGNTSGGPVTASSYVTLGAKPDFLFSSNVNFSVAFWIRMPNIIDTTTDMGDLPWFTDVTNSTFGNGFVFAPGYKLGGWGYSIYDITGNGIGAYGEAHTLDDGTWHHMAYVIDRVNGNSIYLDGRPGNFTNQATPSGPIGNMDYPVQPPAIIGQDPTGQYPEPGSSDIDDLGVWRKALNPAEVAAIYLAAQSNGVSFVGAPITLTMTHSGSNLILNWNAGTLQSADNVTGPWVNVVPVPPYTAPTTAPRKFYRVKL